MSKHFKSLLKVVDSSPTAGEQGGPFTPFQITRDRAQIIFTPPSAAAASQPHPQHLSFDQIFLPSEEKEIFSHSVREVVQSVLLGYHGTVLSFSSSQCTKERMEFLEDNHHGIIQRAANQMLQCLKKHRKSKSVSSLSASSSSSLVMLCSYIILFQEETWDLLFDYSLPHEAIALLRSSPPPALKMSDGKLSATSYHALSSMHKVKAVLNHGRENILRFCKQETQNYHTIFALTVEFSQFGSMNAPVSGNLMFVNVADSDPIGQREKILTGSNAHVSAVSLFTFADVVESYSLMESSGEKTDSHKSALSTDPSEICSQSLLTQLLIESLGGNCKTILITHVPSHFRSPLCPEVYKTLTLASQARLIENKPNKRELAEKALMSAYMRGLEEMYGHVKRDEKESQKKSDLVGNKVSDSHDSAWGDDENAVYMEMIKATSEEQR